MTLGNLVAKQDVKSEKLSGAAIDRAEVWDPVPNVTAYRWYDEARASIPGGIAWRTMGGPMRAMGCQVNYRHFDN